MSQASIPDITPTISIKIEETIPLLLASIALEELALAHILNTEAEKMQFVLGTLNDKAPPDSHSISNILLVNTSLNETMQNVIKT